MTISIPGLVENKPISIKEKLQAMMITIRLSRNQYRCTEGFHPQGIFYLSKDGSLINIVPIRSRVANGEEKMFRAEPKPEQVGATSAMAICGIRCTVRGEMSAN